MTRHAWQRRLAAQPGGCWARPGGASNRLTGFRSCLIAASLVAECILADRSDGLSLRRSCWDARREGGRMAREH